MARTGATFSEALAEAQRLGLRRGRPGRGRRRPRRRRQDGDPGAARLRHARAPRPGPLRGHRADQARRPRVRARARSRAEADRHGRADRRRAVGARAPGLPVSRAPAGVGQRAVQRGHRRVRGDHRDHDVRTRRRRAADRERGARRRDQRDDPARLDARRRRRCSSSSPTSSPPSICTSRWPTSPGVLAQVAQVLAEQGVSVKSVVQKGLRDQARLVMVVHPVLESRFVAAMEADRRARRRCARRPGRSGCSRRSSASGAADDAEIVESTGRACGVGCGVVDREREGASGDMGGLWYSKAGLFGALGPSVWGRARPTGVGAHGGIVGSRWAPGRCAWAIRPAVLGPGRERAAAGEGAAACGGGAELAYKLPPDQLVVHARRRRCLDGQGASAPARFVDWHPARAGRSLRASGHLAPSPVRAVAVSTPACARGAQPAAGAARHRAGRTCRSVHLLGRDQAARARELLGVRERGQITDLGNQP